MVTAGTVSHNLPIGIEIHNLYILKPPTTESDLANYRKAPFYKIDNNVTDGPANGKYDFATSTYSPKYLFSSSTDLSDTSLFVVGIYKTVPFNVKIATHATPTATHH